MLQEVIKFYLERSDFLLPLIVEHLQISLIAILFATIVGISIGIFISEIRKASPLVLGMTSFLYTIPSISMLGFLIPFSGIGNKSAIIALSLYALLPIIRSTYTGITGVDSSILEAARGMGSTRMQTLFRIKLPLAMPVIISGFRNMVVMTIALAGIASFIGAGGLGVAIYRGITTNNMGMTIAGSLAVALLALCCDLLLGIVEKFFSIRHHTIGKKKRIILSLLAISLFTTFLLTFLPNKKSEVHIATKPMTESLILGEMLKQLIENRTDLTVDLTKGVGGGSSNIHAGMLNNDFDIYPEYTGTAWSYILKNEYIQDQDLLFKALKKQYEQQFNFTWVGLYGFDNTYGIAVTKELAERYNLKSYSDLSRISSQLIFGAEYDFYERDDGYNAMVSKYAFKFSNTVDLDIGLKYTALHRGEVDAIIVYRTDGDLYDKNTVLLEDDLQFFPKYFAGSVVTQQTLQDYPQLKEVLMLLNSQISEQDMAQMNYAVNQQKKDEKDVAHSFLQKKHLLEETS